MVVFGITWCGMGDCCYRLQYTLCCLKMLLLLLLLIAASSFSPKSRWRPAKADASAAAAAAAKAAAARRVQNYNFPRTASFPFHQSYLKAQKHSFSLASTPTHILVCSSILLPVEGCPFTKSAPRARKRFPPNNLRASCDKDVYCCTFRIWVSQVAEKLIKNECWRVTTWVPIKISQMALLKTRIITLKEDEKRRVSQEN